MDENKLSEDLKYWRSERPDEWTMDRFIKKAIMLETASQQANPADSKEPVFVCPECGLEHYSYMASSKCCR